MLRKRIGVVVSTVALLATLVPSVVLAVGDGITINEIRIDQPGSDNDEYFELTGDADASLDGLTYLVIGDGTGGSGVIESVTSLDGESLSGTGFFVAAEASFTAGTADLTTSLNFENGDNVTHMLVSGFSGSNGDDLDTDDDGALDTTPWTEVVDSVALIQSATGGDQIYSTTIVGPDGTFVPGHAYDCVEDEWQIGSFSSFDDDTPGAVNVCDAPPPPPPPEPTEYLIHEIQGSGFSSDEVDEFVSIEGVVTAVFQTQDPQGQQLGGFYVQEEQADWDDDTGTSEGLFVFAPFADVEVGDIVEVAGTVVEFDRMTELTDVESVMVNGTSTADLVETTVSLPATDADWEAVEGMLISFDQDLYINEFFNFDRSNEIVLGASRQYQGTHLALPGPAALAIADDNELNRITLDDGRTSQNPDWTRHPNGDEYGLDNTFRGGDILRDVVGVMHEGRRYAFSTIDYRIQPTQGATYVSVNPRPTAPDAIGGEVKVATFNVLNFFTHIDNGPDICGPTANLDCRGADSLEEYNRQLDKLVAGIIALDADVVGIQEIENDIRDDDGNRMHDPVLTLVEELNAVAGAGTWAWVGEANHYNDYPVRNDIIYKPAKVTPIGAPVAYADAAFDDVRPGDIEPLGRPPLSQTFRPNVKKGGGQKFAVIVNHFKSKGSSCSSIGDPDLGDGAGNCNLTRLAQSDALLDFVETIEDDVMGVLLIGDFNSYAMEDPVRALESGGFTDLLEHFIGPDAYSYVFDGQLGYLDYVFASRSMLNKVTGVTSFHINADEPDILDYDTSFKSDPQIDMYEPLPYRVSDHDPVIVGIKFSGK